MLEPVLLEKDKKHISKGLLLNLPRVLSVKPNVSGLFKFSGLQKHATNKRAVIQGGIKNLETT